MGPASLILFVIAVALYLISLSYNGHGPEAGCMGLIIRLIAAMFCLVGLIVGCIWIGMQLK